VVIFDCNGVLVDSEPLATAIVSQEFIRAGFPLTPDMIARYFTGRRPADMFAVWSSRRGVSYRLVSLRA
jgi:beta-phosphoglucomutase-like phosphatase (HAD superfamily)